MMAVQLKKNVISHPKTFTESLALTKSLTCAMLSRIIIDRKLFKDVESNEISILGVPVKLIKCKNNPAEIKFSYCVKIALDDLQNKYLESLSLIVASKETGDELEEYAIRYKYQNDDQIGIELSQQDKVVANFNSPEDKKKIKDGLLDMLERVKIFMKSVKPIRDEIVIKLRLKYNDGADIPICDSEYFTWKEVTETLKGSCNKIKLGKTVTKFNTTIFTARSKLIRFSGDDDDEPAPKKSKEN